MVTLHFTFPPLRTRPRFFCCCVPHSAQPQPEHRFECIVICMEATFGGKSVEGRIRLKRRCYLRCHRPRPRSFGNAFPRVNRARRAGRKSANFVHCVRVGCTRKISGSSDFFHRKLQNNLHAPDYIYHARYHFIAEKQPSNIHTSSIFYSRIRTC